MVVVVNAAVSSHNWIGETYSGYDSFLGTFVSAYTSETQATLFVHVYSNYWVGNPYFSYRPVNVSAVKVRPDWNINYTSTEVSADHPLTIDPYHYHTFTITFTIPDTTIASPWVVHSYDIYVEHVNSTTGPTEVVDTWTSSGSNLAVYSAQQTACMEIAQKYAGMSPPDFSYPEAQVLWSQAMIESNRALNSYTRGNFVDAQTHYQTMDDLVTQALNTESIKGSRAADADANAAVTQSYGYLFIGLGVTLFGIGMVIYSLRRK